MAEPQPPAVVEGANTGDVEDEVQKTATSGEDRKAAAAMAKLDAKEDEGANGHVDHKAASKLKDLGSAEKKEVKKVKVDAADVALLVGELELTKAKATELLKTHEGDAVKAMKAFIEVQ